jgi:hypothetical protein
MNVWLSHPLPPHILATSTLQLTSRPMGHGLGWVQSDIISRLREEPRSVEELARWVFHGVASKTQVESTRRALNRLIDMGIVEQTDIYRSVSRATKAGSRKYPGRCWKLTPRGRRIVIKDDEPAPRRPRLVTT